MHSDDALFPIGACIIDTHWPDDTDYVFCSTPVLYVYTYMHNQQWNSEQCSQCKMCVLHECLQLYID